jgi:flavin-dependent dehydrogenase
MPDGLAALRSLGVTLDGADAQPFRGIRFVDRGVSVESVFPEGYALGVRRTVLHSKMVEAAAAAGVRMLWGAPVGGICPRGVSIAGETIRARWIVGADGFHSRVRRWSGLAVNPPASQRFGFRIHYAVAPWSDYMELHWGAGCQIYVTPIGPHEVCAALISRNPRLRLDEALTQFPQLAARLNGAPRATTERGAVTANRRLSRVYRGNVALIGDASGSVDAITGEGLCLSFQQAIALADSMASGDLAGYQAAHRRLAWRPTLMSKLMLTMDRRTWLRKPAFRAMAAEPRIFQTMLSFQLCAPTFS